MTTHHELLIRWSDRIRVPDDPDACWIWTGQVNNWGYAYAVATASQQKVAVHRVFYEIFKGPIPDGKQIDHICRVRNCLNPNHLQALSSSENIALGRLRKTHCPKGHLYDPEYVRPDTGHRKCRECVKIINRAAYLRRKAAKE